MEKLYIKIKGITCNHCVNKISKELLAFKDIENVTIENNIALVEGDKLNLKNIVNKINEIGYGTKLEWVSKKKPKVFELRELILYLILAILIILLLYYTVGLDFINYIPVINENASLVMLCVLGLLTSVHCIAMCGAINLIAVKDDKRSIKKPILYNFGRLVSYTILGGIIGGIGSVLSISPTVQGIIIIIASIIMLLMALQMSGLINFKFTFKRVKYRGNNAFIIGLLNGLMPCGPLQMMQVYALSTGSIFMGALSMFLFCIGTIPLMLLFGLVINILSNKLKTIVNKISIIIIIVLSIGMLYRGLNTIGVNLTSYKYQEYQKSEIIDGVQYIEFDLWFNGYVDMVLQKDIPVVIIINATEKQLTGCNNTIYINEYGIQQELQVGENRIEFTPTEVKEFSYSCWMGMLVNKIAVIDDLDYFES